MHGIVWAGRTCASPIDCKPDALPKSFQVLRRERSYIPALVHEQREFAYTLRSRADARGPGMAHFLTCSDIPVLKISFETSQM